MSALPSADASWRPLLPHLRQTTRRSCRTGSGTPTRAARNYGTGHATATDAEESATGNRRNKHADRSASHVASADADDTAPSADCICTT